MQSIFNNHLFSYNSIPCYLRPRKLQN